MVVQRRWCWYSMITSLVLVFVNVQSQTIWIATISPRLPLADDAMAAGAYNGSIFLLGGRVNPHRLTIYDVEQNEFSSDEFSLSETVVGYSQHYTSVQDILYILTYNQNLDSNQIIAYNMANRLYIGVLAEVSQTIYFHGCLASSSTMLYVVGGQNDVGGLLPSTAAVQVLVLATNQWLTNVPSMNIPRTDHCCIFAERNNAVYAIGGKNQTYPYTAESSVEALSQDNLHSNSWEFQTPLTFDVTRARAVAYEQYILVIGGIFSHSTHVIDTLKNEVTVASGSYLLAYPVSHVAAVIDACTAYVFGGENYEGSAQLYTDQWMHAALSEVITDPLTRCRMLTQTSVATMGPTAGPSMGPTMRPTAEPNMGESVPDNEHNATVTVMTTTSSTLASYCEEIVVELRNLKGISSVGYAVDAPLQQLVANSTYQAMARGAEKEDLYRSLFAVDYESVVGDINVTHSVCSSFSYVLNVLHDVVVSDESESREMSEYVRQQTVAFFRNVSNNSNVNATNLEVHFFWSLNDVKEDDDRDYGTLGELKFSEIPPSAYITAAILSIFLLFTLAAFVDAKLLRKNDYFLPKGPIVSGFEVTDTALDVLFAVSLLLLYLRGGAHGAETLIASIASFGFVVIPISFSIYQLIRQAKKSWFADDHLSVWLRDKGKFLFLLSIITGSSYTAIEIVNCGAFKLELFSMGLTRQQQIKFNTNKVFGVVLLENIPQMAIQIWYLTRFGADFLPIMAIIFALISIALTILTIYTQRAIAQNQNTVQIEFDVTGTEIKPSLATNTNGIRGEIAMLLGLNESLMEIQRPSIIVQGLLVRIHVFAKANAQCVDYDGILQAASTNSKLRNIIKEQWDLQKAFMIRNINVINDASDTVQLASVKEYTAVTTIDTDEPHIETRSII